MKNILLPFIFGLIVGLCISFLIGKGCQIKRNEYRNVISGEIFSNNKMYYNLLEKEAGERKNNPYTVQSKSTNRTDVTINIPQFFSLNESEQEIFLERTQEIGKYQLYLNIDAEDAVDTGKIRDIFGGLIGGFHNLTVSFYNYPTNTYDIFESISWIASENMQVSLMLLSPKFPLGFDFGEFLRKTHTMIQRNNQGIKIQSLWLSFVPNIDGVHIFLMDNWEKILQNMQTRHLWTDRIRMNISDTFTNSLKGKERLMDFFKASPIEKIEINGVGKKDSGNIMLDGF